MCKYCEIKERDGEIAVCENEEIHLILGKDTNLAPNHTGVITWSIRAITDEDLIGSTISYCPFCGEKLRTEATPEEVEAIYEEINDTRDRN